MKAEEMRKITEQAELESANNFWNDFKDILFQGLKRQAECRCYGLALGCRDELSKTKHGCNWITYKPLRDKVTYELEQLGYKITYTGSGDSASFVINWGNS